MNKTVDMVFVRDSLSAVRRQDLETECELLWIKLSSNISKILFGVFYRPPSSTSDYLSHLEISLAGIPSSQSIILCGDFNAPENEWGLPLPSTRVASSLCEIAQDFSLHQLVTEATTGNSTLDRIQHSR